MITERTDITDLTFVIGFLSVDQELAILAVDHSPNPRSLDRRADGRLL